MGEHKVRRAASMQIQRLVLAYLLIIPALLFVLGVLGYGVFQALVNSFYDVHMLRIEQPFVGFRNYIQLFNDPRFINSFQRSLIFVFSSVILATILAFVGALSLYRMTRLQGLSQGLSLIPYFVSGIAAAISWRFLFVGQAGLINMLLVTVGGEAITWLGHPGRAMAVVVMANVWRITPFSVLIILSGLQTIDTELFDAADIDGATGPTKFFRVMLPLIAPMIGVSFVWLNFSSFNMFDVVLAMTGGGPLGATDFMALYLYRMAFRTLDFSGASAVMIMLLLINILVSVISLKFSKSRY